MSNRSANAAEREWQGLRPVEYVKESPVMRPSQYLGRGRSFYRSIGNLNDEFGDLSICVRVGDSRPVRDADILAHRVGFRNRPGIDITRFRFHLGEAGQVLDVAGLQEVGDQEFQETTDLSVYYDSNPWAHTRRVAIYQFEPESARYLTLKRSLSEGPLPIAAGKIPTRHQYQPTHEDDLQDQAVLAEITGRGLPLNADLRRTFESWVGDPGLTAEKFVAYRLVPFDSSQPR